MYSAQVVADNSVGGQRVTSLEVTYPHAIHKDIMTHRVFSRNFQSFRAFPPNDRVGKDGKVIRGSIGRVIDNPFIPEVFQGYVKGMGQGEPVAGQLLAHSTWMKHVGHSVEIAKQLASLNLAKAQVNFVIQDLSWITGIITAVDWDNFFDLRLALDPDTGEPLARPEVYKIASLMKDAIDSRLILRKLGPGDWTLPYVTQQELDEHGFDVCKLLSAARCARLSYLTHDGVLDLKADLNLAKRLAADKHMSPFEHQVTVLGETEKPRGNLRGVRQFRTEVENGLVAG